jgi:hypothetical protein
MKGAPVPVHVRTIRTSVLKVSDDELEVTGQLLDERPGTEAQWFGIMAGSTIHDMWVTMRVRHPNLEITDVSARMATHPYLVCTDAIPALRKIVGLSVARGFTRAVNERLGREQGCSHLTALVQAMAPVVRQGAGVAFRDQEAMPRDQQDLWFVNTCHAWREKGPLHQRLMAGDAQGIRDLSAYGRTPDSRPNDPGKS